MWLKNLSLKITALGLAVLLWFHVATDRTYDYSREVELRPGPLPSGFALAAPLPEKVKLYFTGTGKELLRFMWEDASAQLLLEPGMAGAFPVSIERLVAQSDADVQISQVIEPATIEVFVDTVITRFAAVRFQGSYDTAPEVALKRAPQVEPQRVQLRGPQSVVTELLTLQTQPVDVGTITSDLTRAMALELTGAFNVTATPDSVNAVFEVGQRMRKVLDGVAVETAEDVSVEPGAVSLELSGEETVLASITDADCRATAQAADEESWAVVAVEVPPLVDLESVTPERVRVSRR